MSQPTPAERLRERLEHLPDGCRALVAAIERVGLSGGGAVAVVLYVADDGHVRAVEVPVRYERRA